MFKRKRFKFEKIIRAEICSIGDLPNHERELIYKATIVRGSAQAPYSNYLIGAAVESEKGSVYVGCNVERCTWSQTTHAEQNAVDSMVAAEGSLAKIGRIAIAGGPRDLKIGWPPAERKNKSCSAMEISVPCGHCLQIIWENCQGDEDVEILDFNPATGAFTKITIGNAFPFRFGPGNLGVEYRPASG